MNNSCLQNTDESVKRFVIHSRSLFVDSMSSFEYETRNFILNQQDSQLDNLKQELQNNPTKGITSIINALLDIGYLTIDDRKLVVGLLFAIRNMIVHSHSIVSNQKDFVPDKLQNMFSDFPTGKRMYGQPIMFLNFIEKLREFYLCWHDDKNVLKNIFEQEKLANHH